MRAAPRISVQCLFILALSAVVGFAVNAVRPDGLPLASAAQSSVRPAAASGGEIGVKGAALLYLGGRAVFLDARSPLEYAMGHIKGAISLPVVEFAERYQSLKPRLLGKEAVVTYCDGVNCPLGARLARHLREAGLKNVYVLKNGWTLWRAEKLPTERGSAAAGRPAPRGGQCFDCGN